MIYIDKGALAETRVTLCMLLLRHVINDRRLLTYLLTDKRVGEGILIFQQRQTVVFISLVLKAIHLIAR